MWGTQKGKVRCALKLDHVRGVWYVVSYHVLQRDVMFGYLARQK